MNNTTPKIAISVSHPIQHFCPMYASWALRNDIHVKVFFASSLGATTYTDKDFGKEVKWGNLNLEAFPHMFLNGGNVMPVVNTIDAPDLEEALEAYKPDALVVYGYSQKFQQRAFNWAKSAQKKIFYISDSERAHHEPPWRWTLKRLKHKSFFQSVDVCLTVGNHNEHYYGWMGVPMQKMVRLGFSIDVAIYQPAFDNKSKLASTVRSKYHIPINHVVISVVGKLINRKRQIDLVKALLLLEKTSSVLFTALIIGSGPDQSIIEAEASKLKTNHAIVTGFIAPEDLPGYYAASDVYAHLSEHDPHTLAVGEAIYMGCPIIVSDRCGVHGTTDDVQIGKNGFVFQCGDIRALANLIAQLGEHELLRKQFSEYSHHFGVESQLRAHHTGIEAALRTTGLL